MPFISNKWVRYTIYYLLFFFVLNVVWYGFIIHERNNKYIKTSAIVKEVRRSTYNRKSITSTKDVTFAYSAKGKEYSYNSNQSFNGLTKIFWGVEQGDRVGLYYEKSNPNNSLPVRSQDYWLIICLPLFVGGILLPLIVIFVFIMAFRKRHPELFRI